MRSYSIANINMNPENSLCASCRRKEAEVFCACISPEALLCGDCIRKHIINNPWKEHTTRPLSLLRSYKIPGFFPRLEARREAFPKVREEALNSLQSIDKAILEFTALVEQTLKDLLTHKEATTTKLRETQIYLSREVQFALEEVERTLGEDQPRLATLYGPAFRAMTEQSHSFQLFSFTLYSTAPTSLVSIQPRITPPQDILAGSKNAVVELPSIPPQIAKKPLPPCLAGVFKNTLTLHQVETQRTTRHTLSVDFGAGGSYSMLDESSLLCVGSYPASCSVYALDLLCFQLRSLPSLSAPRCAAGVAKVEGYAYVFGGQDCAGQSQNACSKLDLLKSEWTQLLGMRHPRAGFTPCHYRSLIYLVAAGSKNHRAVETFNPASGAFEVLPISLSKQLGLNALLLWRL